MLKNNMNWGKMDKRAMAKERIDQKFETRRKEIEAEWRDEQEYERGHMGKRETTGAEWADGQKRWGNKRPYGAQWKHTKRDLELESKSDGERRWQKPNL